MNRIYKVIIVVISFISCSKEHITRPYGYLNLRVEGQEEDIREATDAGAIGYIVKAHSIPSEVVKTVEDIVSKHTK